MPPGAWRVGEQPYKVTYEYDVNGNRMRDYVRMGDACPESPPKRP